MRWVFARAVSAGLALSQAFTAQAQAPLTPPASDPFLSVTREPGAEGCPDTEALAAHVRHVRGQQATSATVAYHVTFSHRGGVFRASIRVGSAPGARVLRDRGATCTSLEQATALTLALLLDSDASELSLEEPEAAAPPAAPVVPVGPAAEAPAEGLALSRSHVNFMLAAGGAGLSGVLSPIAPAVTGELGIAVGRFRAHVGALWVPEQTLDLAPGTVNEDLLSGVARMCLAPWQGPQLRLDLCSGVYVGLLQVRANGYTRDGEASKAWLAIPLELSLLTTAAPMGVELGASALLPLRRNDFSIDNLGVAYESWPVGLLVSMRAVGSWLL